MRYTPSGLPLIDCVLHHVSQISEAGQLRQVEVEAPAMAFESVALRLANSRLDQAYRFIGFVANRSRKSKRTVFHITAFEAASASASDTATRDPVESSPDRSSVNTNHQEE